MRIRSEALHRWSPLTADRRVLWLKYSFGLGTANCVAARLADGAWMVISPAAEAPDSVFDELTAEGEVQALVAPNAYHSLGQSQWRKRFPDALSYAAQGSLQRLAKTASDVSFLTIGDLLPKLEPSCRVFEPDGMKSPDLMIQIETDGQRVWWLGDLFSNSTKADQVWLLRQLARFAGSGLGFRCSSKPEMVYVGDRDRWKASVRSELATHPPSLVVPAHGDPVTADAAARTQAALEKLRSKQQ